MIPTEKLIHLRVIEIEKHNRMASQIQKSIADLSYLADKLKNEISAEERRTKNYDPAHISYPTFAKAAIQRRNNLLNSIDEFKIKLEDTKNALREKNEESSVAIRLVERAQMPLSE